MIMDKKMIRMIAITAMFTVCVLTSFAGNPPVTPAWAFRHVVWEDSINTAEGAVGIVEGYLNRNIPVGSVIIDSPWSTSYNDFNWDTERYPEPENMIGYFKDKGVKVILWLAGAVNYKCKDTALDKGDTYDEVVYKNLGINDSKPGVWWKGEGVHIDFTNPIAREWWYRQLDKVFIDGVYGWKVDQGEYWFGDTISTSLGKMSNEEFRPYYYDAMYDYTVSRRKSGVIIARPYSHQGGFAASVSKLNMGWCGDFSGCWNGLKLQIDNIYRSAMKGYGSLACEVGGFFQAKSTKSQLIRYAQFGCMTAAMINGGENGAFSNHLPWFHDKEAEDIYRKCVILHEELVPYLFSSSVVASRNGGSLLRVIDFDSESHCLGSSLFTKAITTEDGRARYRLPEGAEWIDIWSGARYAGGTEIEETYPIGRFPLFVRIGSIIPVDVADDSFWCADNKVLQGTRTFLVYPGSKNTQKYHLPVGDGVEWEDFIIGYDSSEGILDLKCPSSQKVNVIIKGIPKVKEVRNVSSWKWDNNTGDLTIVAEGRDVTVSILSE